LGNLRINVSIIIIIIIIISIIILVILKETLRTWGDVTSQKKALFTVAAVRICPLINNTPPFNSNGTLPLM